MRPHGAPVNALRPQAHAICDRCGFRYLHRDLSWQLDWVGPRLANKRILVCPDCYDAPQEQLRTIVLPPDPVPIANPRPENYVDAGNPLSPLGFQPKNLFTPQSQVGAGSIGNLTLGGGVERAFDSVTNRRAYQGAWLANSQSSYQNWVGKNWAADPSGVTALVPSTLPAQTHSVSAFTAYAPNDQAFLATGATGYQLQGSANGVTWTALYAGTTAGTVGEILTSVSTGFLATNPYQYHRLALQGDGLTPVGIAQLLISVSDGAPEP